MRNFFSYTFILHKIRLMAISDVGRLLAITYELLFKLLSKNSKISAFIFT
jgi:hypothetical protein